jgi:hypothetical protein
MAPQRVQPRLEWPRAALTGERVTSASRYWNRHRVPGGPLDYAVILTVYRWEVAPTVHQTLDEALSVAGPGIVGTLSAQGYSRGEGVARERLQEHPGARSL